MSPEEAAEAAVVINPTLAIPMHYGSGVAGTDIDADRFVKLCEEKGITAKKLEKI
jgi:L-ascorbate metabolism protein UlaG (beta-lactamase superfamily)